MPEQQRWPKGTPGGGHRPGPGPGRWRGSRAEPQKWVKRISDQIEGTAPQTDQAVSEGVLPLDWRQQLANMDPGHVNRVYRRNSPPPPAAPDGPTGPAETTTVADLADRLNRGEQGWQMFWQVNEGDIDGVWIELGAEASTNPHSGQIHLYAPDKQYRDTRSPDEVVWVRRAQP